MVDSVVEASICNKCATLKKERDYAISSNYYFNERLHNQKKKYTLAMKTLSANIQNLRKAMRDLEKISMTRQKVIQFIKRIQIDDAKKQLASCCLRHVCSKYYMQGLMDMKSLVDSTIEMSEAVEGPMRYRRDTPIFTKV